jgi:hypothetical protein
MATPVNTIRHATVTRSAIPMNFNVFSRSINLSQCIKGGVHSPPLISAHVVASPALTAPRPTQSPS